MGWHVVVGVTFALGLEVHLHTAAAAFAVGFVYLIQLAGALRRTRAANGPRFRPLAGFVLGYALGAFLFVVVSVAPNPQGFFRTAALARLSAADSATDLNLTAPMDFTRLAQTFLSPTTIVRKEVARYKRMVSDMSWWERLVWLVGLPTFVLLRQTTHAFRGRLLLGAAVLGGGIVLNSWSPLYSAAILPFFVPVVATLVTHGFGDIVKVPLVDVSRASVVVLLALSVAILPQPLSRISAAVARVSPTSDCPGATRDRQSGQRYCIVRVHSGRADGPVCAVLHGLSQVRRRAPSGGLDWQHLLQPPGTSRCVLVSEAS